MARLQGMARPGSLRPAFAPADLFPALWELWQRRELLSHMTIRHLKGQFKQSVLGYAWTAVNPLSQMLILTFVFSRILDVRTGIPGVPYALFLFMGLLPWNFFSAAVSSATGSVSGAAGLVTKVYFPREILPIAAILTKVVDLAVGMLILAGLMVFFGHPPAWTSVWVPLLFLIQFIFTVGLALPLAALNLYFHDVSFLVGVALTLWFYLTPVLYPVPSSYELLFDLNPNALFIEAYRRVVLQGISPGTERVLMGLAISMATFVVGYYLFKKMEPGFADSV
jgi:ABC-type polysaccharide/polyol phosphate export permease